MFVMFCSDSFISSCLKTLVMEIDLTHLKTNSRRSLFIFVTIVVFMFAFHQLLDNPLIFASFAASVFAMIGMPREKMARPRIVVASHLVAAFTGYGLTFMFPDLSFWGAGLAVTITAALMLLFKVQHPPAASTALSFTYNLSGFTSGMNFLIVLGMILCLGIVRAAWHAGVWLFGKFAQEVGEAERVIEKDVKKIEKGLEKKEKKKPAKKPRHRP